MQVLENGATGNVYIEGSDHNQTVDDFILVYAMNYWRFIPSLSDGVPTMSWKIIHVELTAKEMVFR